MCAAITTATRKGASAVLERCLEHLRLLDGFKTQFFPVEATGTDQATDGRLRLSGPWGQAEYTLNVKGRISRDTLNTLIYQLKAEPEAGPRLLMTHHVTPELGHRLQNEALDYVDTAGNMSLTQPPLYIRISGHQPPARPQRTSRLFQTAGLRLMATLLHQPDALQWTYRELSKRSGVSLGAIGYLLEELQEKGYARLRAKEKLELLNRQALFQRWEQGYAESLRPRLFLETCRPALSAKENAREATPQLASTEVGGRLSTTGAQLGPELDTLCRRISGSALQDRLRVGGELGAALLTGYLRPARATLHVADEDHRQTLVALKLIPDPNGPIDLLAFIGGETVWSPSRPDAVPLASPLLIHAELVRHPASDRLTETAKMIVERYIPSLLTDTAQPLADGGGAATKLNDSVGALKPRQSDSGP